MALRASAWGGLWSPGAAGATFDIAVMEAGLTAADRQRRRRTRLVCLSLRKDDLASSTSSASSKLIHGGLRYLDISSFVWFARRSSSAKFCGESPHIVWPLRFVLPHHADLRPAWLLRIGLFSTTIWGRHYCRQPNVWPDDPAGEPLKPEFKLGFEYSDCWAEDARLVVLNARDAADKGFVVAPRALPKRNQRAAVDADRAGRTERTS
jgi:glycerol-3-phosphate dehydrogenase